MNSPLGQISNQNTSLSLKTKFIENYNGFRLYNDEFQSQSNDLILVSEMIETINSSSNADQIEKKLQELLQSILANDFCRLFLWEDSKQKLMSISDGSENNCQQIVDKMIEEGIADWIISEKKIAVVPDLESAQNEIKKFFFVVPLLLSKVDYGLLVLRTNYGRSDIVPKKISLISILSNLAFSAIANNFLYEKVEIKEKEITNLTSELSELSKVASVGEISDNFFHTMKNRVQVMISSLELIKKNVKTEDVMKILKAEVDRTSKALKSISDFSRSMFAKYDYGYYGINSIISSTVDVLEATLSKAKLNVEVKEHPMHPQFYGSANAIMQVLVFVLNELRKQLSTGSSILIECAEQQERISIKIISKDTNPETKDFYELFIEKHNVKFAAAKRLIEQNRGAFTSAIETNNKIVLNLTIPKRVRGLKSFTSN